jgi:hypothetical protein
VLATHDRTATPADAKPAAWRADQPNHVVGQVAMRVDGGIAIAWAAAKSLRQQPRWEVDGAGAEDDLARTHADAALTLAVLRRMMQGSVCLCPTPQPPAPGHRPSQRLESSVQGRAHSCLSDGTVRRWGTQQVSHWVKTVSARSRPPTPTWRSGWPRAATRRSRPGPRTPSTTLPRRRPPHRLKSRAWSRLWPASWRVLPRASAPCPRSVAQAALRSGPGRTLHCLFVPP